MTTVSQDTDHAKDTSGRANDIPELVFFVDGTLGVEVRCPAGVILARDIGEEIHRPAKGKLKEHAIQDNDGSFVKGIMRSIRFSILLTRRQTVFLTSSGDKDLIMVH